MHRARFVLSKPVASKAQSERKHISETEFSSQRFRTRPPPQDPSGDFRVWVVGTFSLYLEPCWHVAWRRFLNFLNAPKFAPELHQHGSKMGPRWPQAGPGQLKMALRWPKRATRPSKSSQNGPKTATRPPKLALDGPQDGPRWLQDGHKTAQDGPRKSQDGPRQCQDGSKMAPGEP